MRIEVKKGGEIVRNKVATAKAEWLNKRAHILDQMCHTPKDVWVASRKLITGNTCHHTTPVPMKKMRKNGKLAINNKENMVVVAEHLNKVYNTHQNRFADAAKMFKQREVFCELDVSLTWQEFT